MTREEAIEYNKNLRMYMKISDKNQPCKFLEENYIALDMAIKALEQEPKMGHCKDCKYFEYNKVAKVDGVPLIVAHEICNKWGDGCKTKEDGYCFLFDDPQESEDVK